MKTAENKNMKSFNGLICGKSRRTGVDSFDYFSINYDGLIKELELYTWYDILPYSTALWLNRYSETQRCGKWWMHRDNYAGLCMEYIVSGNVKYYYNDVCHVLEPGDLWLTLPGDMVTTSDHNQKKLHRIQLSFNGGLTKIAPDSLGLHKKRCYHIGDLQNGNKFSLLVKEAKNLLSFKNPAMGSRNSLLAYEMLLFLAEISKQDVYAKDDLPGVLTNTLHRMMACTVDGYSISELAAFSNVSRMTLNRLFKRHLNTTPLAYWMNLKIEHAKQVLTDSDKPIKEIASELGFRNQLYFSTVFRRHTGLSPSEYRKQELKERTHSSFTD